MGDRSPVTREQAVQAQESLTQVISFEDIFGPADLVTRMQQSMGVTAEAPAFEDHYIEIIAPLAIDVSRIPSEIDGVRIVVIHEDRPGFYAT